MKILFVSTRDQLEDRLLNGGTALSRNNVAALRRLGQVSLCSTIPPIEGKMLRMLRYATVLWGKIGGLTPLAELRILMAVAAQRPDLVFLDHSQLGSLCRPLKQIFPQLRIVVHFHNVESDYIRTSRSGLAPFLDYVVAVAEEVERCAIENGDYAVFLTEADRATARCPISKAGILPAVTSTDAV
jgi:hypothetical protein